MTSHAPLSHHLRATLSLGLPLVGSHMAQIVVGMTDTIMLGWYGVPELAAAVLGSTFFHVAFILGLGFSFAVLPKVAAAHAQGDEVKVRRVTRMGLWLVMLWALLSLPLFYYSGPILLALGQEEQVSADAQIYLRIAGIGMIPALIVAGLRSHLAGLERTGIVLWATLIATVVNVGMNWVLIFGNLGAPELGLAGAAIASVGVHVLMAVILIGYARYGPQMAQFTLFARMWRPDWPEFVEIFRLGWPISLTLLSESALFSASAIMIGWMGTLPLAAHGIALQITSLTFMAHVGLASAATVRAGAAFGSDNALALQRAAHAALLLSAAAVAVTIVLFLGVPGPLVAVFIDPADPARDTILTIGIALLAVAALFQVVDAAQVMALGLLRGIQDTSVPMLFAFVGYWVIGIPASYLFGFTLGWGPEGVWLGMAAGLTIAGALMMHRFWTNPAVRP